MKGGREPRSAVLGALVGCLGAAVFGPALGAGFVYDDHPLIADNLYVHSLAWWRRWLTRDFWDVNEEIVRFGRRMIYWRPAVSASYALDWVTSGGSPVYFHAVNLAWHALASVLAFFALRRWIGSAVPAAFAALLFAVHPTKAESVAWIAGRTDVLCAVAMLVAAHGCALRLRGRRTGLLWEAFGTLLAYAVKEQALTLAGLVAVEAWVALGRPALDRGVTFRIGRTCAPQLALAGIYLALRAWFLPVRPAGGDRLPFSAHAREVLESIGRYAELTFVPHDLSIQQGLMQTEGGKVAFSSAYVALGALFVALAALVGWAMRKRRPAVTVGILLYAFLLLPTSNLIPTEMTTMISERFLYLPILGLSLAAGDLLRSLQEGSAAIPVQVACAVLSVAFGMQAARRAADFTDEHTFWARELRLHPNSLEALRFQLADESRQKHFGRALELAARGQQIAVSHYSGAGYEVDFIVQGLMLLLIKIPDHDRTSLRAIDAFLARSLDEAAPSAELTLGKIRITLPLGTSSATRSQIQKQAPLILGLRAAIKSRMEEDAEALSLAETAHRSCPGCLVLGRIAALVLARAGDYDRAGQILDELVGWTGRESVAETRRLLATARGALQDARATSEVALRVQRRATELSALEAWGRAYDVLLPYREAIEQAPEFALGFAELAFRAGEFRVAREVLAKRMPPDELAAMSQQWSRKMGWIDAEPVAENP